MCEIKCTITKTKYPLKYLKWFWQLGLVSLHEITDFMHKHRLNSILIFISNLWKDLHRKHFFFYRPSKWWKRDMENIRIQNTCFVIILYDIANDYLFMILYIDILCCLAFHSFCTKTLCTLSIISWYIKLQSFSLSESN